MLLKLLGIEIVCFVIYIMALKQDLLSYEERLKRMSKKKLDFGKKEVVLRKPEYPFQ